MRDVPLVAFHGARDTIIKFDGGALGLPIPFETFPIEETAIPLWAAHNDCDAVPEDESLSDNVRAVRFTGCNADVELYVLEEARHEWPGARGGDPEADEIDATDFMWDFFETHSLDGEGPPPPTSQVAGSSTGRDEWAWIIALVVTGALAAAGGAIWLRRTRRA
jgi:poly(3-hydroxybutyrate) depolymerase